MPSRGTSSEIATRAERRKWGRGLRTVLRRADQGNWRPSATRADPLEQLAQIHRRRIRALAPIKLGRMAASPSGFFRGAAPLMAADLAGSPTTGLIVQICGDCHVRNLGAFAAPDGHLVFDLNDFDESMPGPWEWDVKRFATSLVLVGREAGESDASCRRAVIEFVAAYRNAMLEFSEMTVRELNRYEIRRRSQLPVVRAVLGKAERVTPERLLRKLARPTRGLWCFRSSRPLQYRVSNRAARTVLQSLLEFRRTLGSDRQLLLDAYHPVDVAFKVVGTGSVGMRNYVILSFAKTQLDDPLLLQVKEADASCYAPFLPKISVPAHQGQRIAEGQHRIQTVSDPLLGWTTVSSRHYVVRQFADHKAAINPEELRGETLEEYAFVCGRVLAKGHARTGDPLVLASYCGRSDKLDAGIARFAFAYADQTNKDHETLVRAIRQRRVRAVRV